MRISNLMTSRPQSVVTGRMAIRINTSITPVLTMSGRRVSWLAAAADVPFKRAKMSLVKTEDTDNRHESAVDMMAAMIATMSMRAG